MYTQLEKRILEQVEWKSFFKSSTLLLVAFATVFFPRLLDSLGAPSVINFLHFAIVPVTCIFVLLKSKSRDRAQLKTVKAMITGLFSFLCVAVASALVNSAGVVNVILDFLLLCEPLIFLMAIACLPLSQESVNKFRFWFICFNIFHIAVILFQRFVLQLQYNRGLADNIQGVFYRSGSGHVIGASVALSFSIYLLVAVRKWPLWQRLMIFFASLVGTVAADAKQVILVSLLGFAILSLLKIGDIKKIILYSVLSTLLILVSYWAIYQFDFLRPFRTWIDLELYGPDGDATNLKFKGIEIILSHYRTGIEWFLGLGPGHTTDRLGGWMLKDYSDLLSPLGATTTTIGQETWRATSENWLGDRSSFFSPFWGWAALWGDLGFVGLSAYLFLWVTVWNRLCIDDFSKFLVITVFLHGLIFTQLEEPGYTLSVTALIGLRWQEQQAKTRSNRASHAIHVSPNTQTFIEPI